MCTKGVDRKHELDVYIGEEKVIQIPIKGSTWILDSGKTADGVLGRLEGQIAFVSTKNLRLPLKKNRYFTIFRQCLADEIFESYLEISIKNTSPYFVSKLRTSWDLDLD